MGLGHSTDSIQTELPTLRVEFSTLEEFRREYQANLQRGGLFVPTSDGFELRQEVCVELELGFRATSLRLRCEVVSVVPRELAAAGGTPGVALQILSPIAEVRAQLEPIAGQTPQPDPGRQIGERRVSPRERVRVVGRLSSADASLAVHTRDLSHTGVLVSVDGVSPTPVGESVQLQLVHPSTGQNLSVEGTVVRHIESKGRVPALAVAFSEREACRKEVQQFVDDLQSAGHARRLGGITGAIEEVGLPNLLQSFAAASARGTVTVQHGHEEGRVVFEGRMLLGARVSGVTGTKALARMFAWDEGSFEFHADVDETELEPDSLPLEHALIDAARQFDEGQRLCPLPFEMADVIGVAAAAPDGEGGSLSKQEKALIDLARAGFSVRGMLDVIPEEDSAILAALVGLLDRGVLSKSG